MLKVTNLETINVKFLESSVSLKRLLKISIFECLHYGKISKCIAYQIYL